MNSHGPDILEEHDPEAESPFEAETAEEDLWFLPGPPEDEPPHLPPLPRAEPGEASLVIEWVSAQADLAKELAQTAVRFGALDDRLQRGPEGWRHRLALQEASALSWLSGERVTADRLGLWQAMRVGATGGDTAALQRAAWAVRRLSSQAGPQSDLAGFLGRHDVDGSDPLSDRIAGWQAVMETAGALHPLARACFALTLWPRAGIGPEGSVLEGAVVAARLGAEAGFGGARFLPLPLGSALDLRTSGPVRHRLGLWLRQVDQALLSAMRQLDRLEAWEAEAESRTAVLSGRTPPLLLLALRDWPLLTASMAEGQTGASRAAVQRNLAWFHAAGLVQEVTGHGRFRVWRAAI
ncbi:hypothetical protein [Aliiroseovarius sp.]|uniref:hypothetical protein n=1 Tax=Aliiroseovarius sp. TaxID=1872442 RepID=UPI003BACF45F